MDTLIAPLLTIAFGALAGGLTNTVAIWMLFHPHKPLRIAGRSFGFLQGAIPKNQPRLAAAVGRTVGKRLLTESDLASALADEQFRTLFDQRLEEFIDVLLLQERGPLREVLPAPMLTEAESLLEETLQLGCRRFETFIASDGFEQMVEARTETIVEALSDVPVGGALTPARSAALTSALGGWVEGALESEEFYQTVDDYLAAAAESVLAPERTFEQTLPSGMVAVFERAIASYLPLAIARLGALLDDKQARMRFEQGINDMLKRFLRDLRFHQRFVARLVITEDAVERMLDTLREEGTEQITAMLQDPKVQAAMSRGINDAIVDFLRRPVRSVVGEAESESVVRARETAARWVVSTAQDPKTRRFLVDKLEATLHQTGARTWGKVLEHIPSSNIARGLVALARSLAGSGLLERSTRQLGNALLDRPIGVPARWLPEGAAHRLKLGLSDPLWGWLQDQIPAVVRRIDVARRVEEKVAAFPAARMEEIIRRVTEKELKRIIQLGYILGAVIGTLLVLVTRATG